MATECNNGADRASISHDLLSDLELLHRQLSCVQELSAALKEIATMQKETMALHAKKFPGIIAQHGCSSAAWMKLLWNTLSHVDGITDEDAERWGGTIEESIAREWSASLNA